MATTRVMSWVPTASRGGPPGWCRRKVRSHVASGRRGQDRRWSRRSRRARDGPARSATRAWRSHRAAAGLDRYAGPLGQAGRPPPGRRRQDGQVRRGGGSGLRRGRRRSVRRRDPHLLPRARRATRAGRRAGCRAARWRGRRPVNTVGRELAERRRPSGPGRGGCGSSRRPRRCRPGAAGPSTKAGSSRASRPIWASRRRRRALDEHVAQSRSAGRVGGQDVPGQRARAGRRLDHHERIGPAQLVPPLGRGPGPATAANSGPSSGLVTKSPRRPALAARLVEAARVVVEGGLHEHRPRQRPEAPGPGRDALRPDRSSDRAGLGTAPGARASAAEVGQVPQAGEDLRVDAGDDDDDRAQPDGGGERRRAPGRGCGPRRGPGSSTSPGPRSCSSRGRSPS